MILVGILVTLGGWIKKQNIGEMIITTLHDDTIRGR